MTTEPSARRTTTRVSRIIKAPRDRVYHACLDPDALASWRVPDNMTGRMHVFDAREGGTYRMSLTYQDAAPGNDAAHGNATHRPRGKTSDDIDSFQGRFIELVPNEKIIEMILFESPDPQFHGEMKITTSLKDSAQGTEITILCQDIPTGIRPEDNEMGCQSSLRKLAARLE
jgi:uncharacterized protein YndB with AHSA1/START domain